MRLDSHYELLMYTIWDDGKVIWRIWRLVMSFLWSWGGVAVGTEFEIIASCLQGVQMLMELLCLIIKDANLRERRRDIFGNRWTFQKPTSGASNSLPAPSSSPPPAPTSELAVGTGEDNWKPEEWKKTCSGNLTLAASHAAVIKHPPFCRRCPSGEQGE